MQDPGRLCPGCVWPDDVVVAQRHAGLLLQVTIAPREKYPLGQTVLKVNEQRERTHMFTRRYLEEQLYTALAGQQRSLLTTITSPSAMGSADPVCTAHAWHQDSSLFTALEESRLTSETGVCLSGESSMSSTRHVWQQAAEGWGMRFCRAGRGGADVWR